MQADKDHYAAKAAKAEEHHHEHEGRNKHHPHAKHVDKPAKEPLVHTDGHNSHEKHEAELQHKANKFSGKHTSSQKS